MRTSPTCGRRRAAPTPGCSVGGGHRDLAVPTCSAPGGGSRCSRRIGPTRFATAFTTTVIGLPPASFCRPGPARSSAPTCSPGRKGCRRPPRSRRSSSNVCSTWRSCCCSSASSCFTVPAGVVSGDAGRAGPREVLGRRGRRRVGREPRRFCSRWRDIPSGSAALAGRIEAGPAGARGPRRGPVRRDLRPGAGRHASAGPARAWRWSSRSRSGCRLRRASG